LPKRKLNVTIIILDTLKLDTFDMLAKRNPELMGRFDAISFDHCIAPSSWTLPSHASLFTGLYPSSHGSHETRKIKSLDIARIKLRSPTIMGELKERGYRTYGISANPYIHPVYGFTDFDSYVHESYFTDIFGSMIEVSAHLKEGLHRYRNEYGNDVLGLSRAIIRDNPKLFVDLVLSASVMSPRAALKKAKAKLMDGWPLEKGGKNIVKMVKHTDFKAPFFLFLNFMEAHDPYIGGKGNDFNWATPFLKKPVDKRLLEKWKKLYVTASHKAMRYGSAVIADLMERYGDNQMIILTSDHGQAFNEHGFVGHGTVLFDEAVKVPLVVIAPKWLNREKAKGCQSLVNVPEFILSALDGNRDALRMLSSESVYSETFSIPANISKVKGVDKKKMAKLDRYEKRKFTLQEK
jgi:membrane-anchored protein YejM (alkaline phosphatase superfamily)